MKKTLTTKRLLYQVIMKSLQQFFIILLTIHLATAASTSGQNLLERKISLSLQQTTLHHALNKLEKSAGLKFSYNSRALPLNSLVSIQVQNESVSSALNRLLLPLRISYKQVSGRIVLRMETSLTNYLILPLLESNTAGTTTVADRTLVGKISNERGEPVPGVNVVIKGTQKGTQTDAEGKYVLLLPDGPQTLIFSYVGFISQEIQVSAERSALDITLVEDQKALEEVVVVGYGTQKKVNLTGAVATMNREEITRRPVGQTSSALQGMMPGVTVKTSSGQPGSDGGTIRIRGALSGTGSLGPLTLIDGIEGSIDNIDPNLIESISVLKDAASSSIYGSRAAGGVILVTTRRASSDKISVNYNNYVGWQKPTNLPKMANALDHMLLTNEAYVNVGRAPLYSDDLLAQYRSANRNPYAYPDTDWQKEVLTGNGLQQSHFVSINGGSRRVKFLTSLGYLNQNGIIENTGFKRYTLRNNTDIQLSSTLTAKMDMQIVAATATAPARGTGEVFHWMNRIPANQLGINEDGTWAEGWNGDNPIAFSRAGGLSKNQSPYLLLNASLNYRPVHWLSAEVAYAPKYALGFGKNFNKTVQTYTVDGNASFAKPALTTLSESTNRSMYNTLRATVNIDKLFGSHGIKFLAGFQREDFRSDSYSAARQGFTLPDYEVLNAGSADVQTNSGSAAEWALQSFFGRFNYDYKQRYLLEVNTRYDGSSRFAKGKKYGVFPSISAGWRVSQERFMAGVADVINEFKIRGSWGQLGNQNIGNYPFTSYMAFGSYTLNDQIINVAALNDLANSEISWETTTMSDIGLDMTLFNKLSITADYYYKKTHDILLTLDIPLIIGLNAPSQNAGVVENRGWELGINFQDKAGDLHYNIGFNLSDLRNKVLDMRGVNTTGITVSREGYSSSSIYGLQADGFFQNQQEITDHATQFGILAPGDIRYKDQNGDGVINASDYVVLGETVPRLTFGTTINLSYKGFNLNTIIQGVGKANGFLYQQGIMPFYLGGTVQEQHKDRWTPETPNAAFPRLAFSQSNNEQVSSFWMKNAAYVRLKNIQLSYTLPGKVVSKAKIKNLRFFANGQNLFTIDKFWNGYDVEAPVGTGNAYPQVKMFSVGLDANF